nr:hypothetical protein GCM10020093_112740 [Planobispora longispora]
MGLTIGVDIGGTKVAAGVVDQDGRIVEHRLRPTPAENPELVADTIAQVVKELAEGTRSRPSASARPGSSTRPGRS